MATAVNETHSADVSQDISMPTIDNDETPTVNTDVSTLHKIAALKHVLSEDLTGCDAKWTLFVSAAQSYRYLTQLVPFPPQYVVKDKFPDGLDIHGLVKTINDTPRLLTLLTTLKDAKPEDINPFILDLVYWVLVTQHFPFLRSVSDEEFAKLMRAAGNPILQKDKTSHVFMVIYPKDSAAELEFNKANELYPKSYAFYGGQLDTVYSLLSNGFKNYQNPKNNFNGSILELHPTLAVCDKKCSASAAWGFSTCGSILSCIAICEYVDHPHFIKLKNHEDGTGVQHCEKILISNTDLVRVRYLLLYGNRTTDELEEDPKMKSWIVRNKNILSVTFSLVLVVTALASSKRGGAVTSFCSRNIGHALTLCGNSLNLGFLNKFK